MMTDSTNLGVLFYKHIPDAKVWEYRAFWKLALRYYGKLKGFRTDTFEFPPKELDMTAYKSWLVDNFDQQVERYKKRRGQ